MVDSVTSSVFGASSATSFFAIGVSGGATDAQKAAQVSVESAQREINRIRGYKLQLSPADNKKLSEIQEKIKVIDDKARNGTVREDELEDRGELFREADRIIGKPSADVEPDATLEALREKIDELLAPRLSRPVAQRVEQLERLKLTLEQELSNGGGDITRQRLQNVTRQITQLTPARQISQLSVSERVEYDSLVQQVNDYAGAKIVLNARESVRVFNLQKTIDELSSSLPPDPSSQPTAASVARAYSRIG